MTIKSQSLPRIVLPAFDWTRRSFQRLKKRLWLPEFILQKEIGGTIYSVTGAYDGTEALDKKMERVMAERFMDKAED